MNPAIRRVGVALVVLILVLVGQLTYLQLVDANSLNHNPHNTRALLQNINRPRGDIVTADGVVAAHSVKANDGTVFKYQRQYPTSELFAQVVGYESFLFGSTGVEHAYNRDLTGQSLQLQLNNVGGLLSGNQITGDYIRLPNNTQ